MLTITVDSDIRLKVIVMVLMQMVVIGLVLPGNLTMFRVPASAK